MTPARPAARYNPHMRRTCLVALALVATACTGEDPAWNEHDLDSDTDTAVDDTADTEDTEDTAPAGTDSDGDGWTVEDGDCDDDDVQVNPGWTETGRRATDGLDNDCDGLTDERLGAISVIDVDAATGETRRLSYDIFGDPAGETALPPMFIPRWSDVALDGRGRVLLDRQAAKLWELSPEGVATALIDFSDEALGLDLPLGIAGVGTDRRGGAYLVGAVDRLLRVAPAGDGWEVTEAGRWRCHLVTVCESTDGVHDIAAWDVAVDPARGEVRLAGAFGASASWSPAGVVVDVTEDDITPEITFIDFQPHGARGFYALGEDADGFGIWRWNVAQARWALRARWPEPERPPAAFSLDDETGDFYVSANWGWTQELWRVVADGTSAGRLVPAPDVPYTEAETHRYRAVWVEPTTPSR